MMVVHLGPVHMEVGNPGCLGYPSLVGFPASPYILCCLSGCVHMRGGVDFFHVNTTPRGTGVRFIRAFDNLAHHNNNIQYT